MTSIFQSHRFTNADTEKYALESSLFVDCTFEDYDMGTNLTESSFVNCEFSRVSFYWGLLFNAKFSNCRFSNVDFRGANMIGVIFHKCRLSACDFSHDNLGADTDLSPVEFQDSEQIDCLYRKYEKKTGA